MIFTVTWLIEKELFFFRVTREKLIYLLKLFNFTRSESTLELVSLHGFISSYRTMMILKHSNCDNWFTPERCFEGNYRFGGKSVMSSCFKSSTVNTNPVRIHPFFTASDFNKYSYLQIKKFNIFPKIHLKFLVGHTSKTWIFISVGIPVDFDIWSISRKL